MPKLSKRELDFILPAVLYGWKIELQHWLRTPHWEGDKDCPVKVGKVCEALIQDGYLVRYDDSHYPNQATIRATPKGYALKCRKCSKGELYDDNDEKIGNCPHCYRGLLSEVKP